MIHEITPEVLKKDLSNFDIITFDDGLYTQYLNHEHFAKFNKPMYYFISTNIICPINVKQKDEILYCGDAHKKAFNGNFENYMTWSQIKELSKLYNIGGHSHTHPRIKTKSLTEQFKICKNEVDLMNDSFKENEIVINSFCFPYNEEIIIYKALLKGYALFGEKRIAVESI